MKHLFGYLKGHWRAACIVAMLLVVQAFCDLALPDYTSRIVDDGLQSSGIEHSAPEQMSEKSMTLIQLMMTEEELQQIQPFYALENGVYVRQKAKAEELEQLDTLFAVPEVLLYQMKQQTDLTQFAAFTNGQLQDTEMTALDLLAAAYDSGMVSKEVIMAMRQQAAQSMAGMSDTMIEQIAKQFLMEEYAEMGIDLRRLQQMYLLKTGGKMLLMTLLLMLAAICAGLIASRTGAAIGRDLRAQTFEKVIAFSSAEINKFSTASLITRCTNDIQQIQIVSMMMLRMVLYAPILGIGGILKVTATKTGLGWIIFVAVAVTVAVVLMLMRLAMPKFKRMQTLVDNVNRVSREILTGILPIRAFSREKHEELRFDGANTELMRTQLFTNRVMTFMMPSMMFIMYMVMGLIVWFGAKNIDAGMMQVGDMTAFLTYTMQIVMSFMMIAMISIFLPRAGVAADRVYEVQHTEPSINDMPDAEIVEKDEVKGVVSFNDVSFRFPGGERDALEHISFTAEPGKTTAIIGSTGCGKSTLLRLIPRFYDVTDGSITIDGRDVRAMTQKSLRAQIGYVPQKGILFSGDIESNLKFGGDTITDDEMKLAAEIAQAADFIGEKTDGYHSAISQGGSNVSGGQKQRLSIARAVAKKPKIFLFDDSFSALDYKTDSALRRSLFQNVSDATVIIVAQRISTILHAEQIIVLNDGRIDGIGTHEQLLAGCETYREIAGSQLSAAELGMEGGQA